MISIDQSPKPRLYEELAVLAKEYDSYDEFTDYNKLLQMVPLLRESIQSEMRQLHRVHVKVRSIVSVQKYQ